MPKISKRFVPGLGCICGAYGESECGCSGVRWQPDVEIRHLVACAMAVLNHARKATPERMEGTPDYHEKVLERLGAQLEKAIDSLPIKTLRKVD